jgi:hypothetical protein
VRVQRAVDLLLHGSRHAVVADHHDRIEVMGEGAVFLALGGSQLNGSHAPIIPLT